MLLDVLYRHPPPSDVVAFFAIGAKLAAMNIGVTVGAFRAGIAEDQIGVTLAAGNAFVHAPQRKLGLIVLEFRNVAYWFPGGEGVTVLARQRQITVGAARGSGRRGLPLG